VNIPNALTLSRIFIVPLLVVVLLTPVSENWLGVPRYLLGVSIFVAAALTDYFDGKLARSWKQVSTLGKLLDPIADKLLISAALISLVENHLAPAWAVVIIVGREFAVTGLRSIAATEGVIISASKMGKFKMVAQVVTVGLLILFSAPAQEASMEENGGLAGSVIPTPQQSITGSLLGAAFSFCERSPASIVSSPGADISIPFGAEVAEVSVGSNVWTEFIAIGCAKNRRAF